LGGVSQEEKPRASLALFKSRAGRQSFSGTYSLFVFRCSAYHDNCVPAERRNQATQVSTDKKRQEGDYVQCDAVKQDTIWKESVGGEKRCLKNWYVNYIHVLLFYLLLKNV